MTRQAKYPFCLLFRRDCILFLAITLFSISCYQDVIDLDLSDLESKIVIEGNITNQPGPYTVKISRTVGYEKSRDFPRVSDAEVVIADDAGNSETLREIRPGMYWTSSLRGVPGRTYSLSVNVDGKEYTASCTMPSPLELNSILYDIYDQITLLRCEFIDREGTDDFFRLKIYRNETYVETYLYQGRFRDGQSIDIDINTMFLLGDDVMIEMLAIDRTIYEYFSMLGDDVLQSNEGLNIALPDFLPVTVFNPKTNLNDGALGYFSAHAIRTYTFVVE